MIMKNTAGLSAPLRIAIDAMGGDFGPESTMPAVIGQARQHPEFEFVVYGHQQQCQLDGNSTVNLAEQLPENIDFKHVDKQIEMADVPTYALRYGRDSSMAMALKSLARGEVAACITAGNTGALVALSRHMLGICPSIDKPALCKIMPTHLGRSYMLDLGATINCSSDQLVQFARLGAALYKQDNGNVRQLPSVRLLNIGSEHFKGMDVIRDAAESLGNMSSLDYQGYIEGDEIYRGVADIIVCDGFVGNIALKSSEGVARFMLESLQGALSKSTGLSTGLGTMRNTSVQKTAQLNGERDQGMPDTQTVNAVKQWQQACDPARYNGAQLLGVNGLVVKSHGGVSGHAFSQALLMLVEQIKKQSSVPFDDLLNAI